MRAHRNTWAVGLSAAALVLLTACGSSDGESDAASDSSAATSGSSASSSGSGSAESGSSSDEDVQAFCTEAEQVFGQLSEGLDAAQPADLAATLDQAVAAFDEIEPPAEISGDFSTLQQAFTGLRDAVAGADLATPEGQAALQQAATDLQTNSADAQANLEAWTTENCDNA